MAMGQRLKTEKLLLPKAWGGGRYKEMERRLEFSHP